MKLTNRVFSSYALTSYQVAIEYIQSDSYLSLPDLEPENGTPRSKISGSNSSYFRFFDRLTFQF